MRIRKAFARFHHGRWCPTLAVFYETTRTLNDVRIVWAVETKLCNNLKMPELPYRTCHWSGPDRWRPECMNLNWLPIHYSTLKRQFTSLQEISSFFFKVPKFQHHLKIWKNNSVFTVGLPMLGSTTHRYFLTTLRYLGLFLVIIGGFWSRGRYLMRLRIKCNQVASLISSSTSQYISTITFIIVILRISWYYTRMDQKLSLIWTNGVHGIQKYATSTRWPIIQINTTKRNAQGWKLVKLGFVCLSKKLIGLQYEILSCVHVKA